MLKENKRNFGYLNPYIEATNRQQHHYTQVCDKYLSMLWCMHAMCCFYPVMKMLDVR